MGLGPGSLQELDPGSSSQRSKGATTGRGSHRVTKGSEKCVSLHIGLRTISTADEVECKDFCIPSVACFFGWHFALTDTKVKMESPH